MSVVRGRDDHHEGALVAPGDGAAGGRALAGAGRAEFGHLVRDLLVECQGAGVALRTGIEVDAGLVEPAGPDVVVLATGARAALLPWAAPEPGVPRRVFGAARPTGSVLVYDELRFAAVVDGHRIGLAR